MKIRKLKMGDSEFPLSFKQLPQPPKELFVIGAPLNQLLTGPAVSIVGSRKVTAYGRAVTDLFATKLAQSKVVIISGLALGVDSIAHQAALNAGGITIAVLPSSIDSIYPRSHYHLAKSILEHGGALISEHASNPQPQKYDFIARNRLIATLGQGVLITEAAEKSGSLHTARFALEQGVEVMAVPGNINNINSLGTNNLIKQGASAITTLSDVLNIIGAPIINELAEVYGENEEQQNILDLILRGIDQISELLSESNLASDLFSQTLTELEISGKIQSLGSGRFRIS